MKMEHHLCMEDDNDRDFLFLSYKLETLIARSSKFMSAHHND